MQSAALIVSLVSAFSVSALSADRLHSISQSCGGEPSCFTINQLSNFSQLDTLRFQVHPGRHVLTRPDFLVFEDIHSLYIVGATPAAEILCTNNSGVLFLSVDNVVMENLSFLSCGGVGTPGTSKASAVTFRLVANFQLNNVRVLDSTGVGILIHESYG